VWIGEHCKITGDVRIGKYTTLNSGCLLFGKITIGNYCQFGPRVSIYTANHAVNYLTTYNSEALFGGALKQLVEPKQVDIGHDVWLGHGSVIMPGVSLGTGCIVGAGSVVTKAVAPYAIVGGSPARLIRFRLSEPHLERILNSHWWCLDPEELDEFRDVFTELPNKIAESRLEKLSRLGTAKARSMKAGESR
jgi:carbonic anhydrase/acetyltransferase-like protein (isoleucine patch superfamily)